MPIIIKEKDNLINSDTSPSVKIVNIEYVMIIMNPDIKEITPKFFKKSHPFEVSH